MGDFPRFRLHLLAYVVLDIAKVGILPHLYSPLREKVDLTLTMEVRPRPQSSSMLIKPLLHVKINSKKLTASVTETQTPNLFVAT